MQVLYLEEVGLLENLMTKINNQYLNLNTMFMLASENMHGKSQADTSRHQEIEQITDKKKPMTHPKLETTFGGSSASELEVGTYLKSPTAI